MSIYAKSFKPTFLYIKQHSITGLLYFGKTSKSDPVKYPGSGSYWQNHIRKYGKEHVITLWYCLFYDKQDCKDFALSFSEQQNIVEAKNEFGKKIWANALPEQVEDTNDTTGFSPAKDALTHEHLGLISCLDKRWISGEIIHVAKGIPNNKNKENYSGKNRRIVNGKVIYTTEDIGETVKYSYVTIRNDNHEEKRIKIEDPIPKGWFRTDSNMVIIKSSDGKCSSIASNEYDPKIHKTPTSGKATYIIDNTAVLMDTVDAKKLNLRHINSGKVNLTDKFGNKIKVSKDDPRLLDPTFKKQNSGTVNVLDLKSKRVTRLMKNDPRIGTEFIPFHWTKFKKVADGTYEKLPSI